MGCLQLSLMRDIHVIITITARPGLEFINFFMLDLEKLVKYGQSGANWDNTVK